MARMPKLENGIGLSPTFLNALLQLQAVKADCLLAQVQQPTPKPEGHEVRSRFIQSFAARLYGSRLVLFG